jgi:hypothetical protein
MSPDLVKNDRLLITPIALPDRQRTRLAWRIDMTTITYLFLDLFLYAAEKVGTRQAENADLSGMAWVEVKHHEGSGLS